MIGEDPAARRAVPRRDVVCGLLVLGLLGSTAFACGPESPTEPGTGQDGDERSEPQPTPRSTSPHTAAIARLSEVPVGSGTVVAVPDGRNLVLAQPTAGSVVAYDASCTHQGAAVNAPDESGVMTCPQHQSRFRIQDGSVVNGPATRPLTKVPVAVQDDAIVLV